MHLLLDTNSLYYFCGISTCYALDIKRMRSKIDNAETTYISSVTVLELLSKYNVDIDILKAVFDQMENSKIKIIQHKQLPLDSLGHITLADLSRQEYLRLFKVNMPRKIEFESIISAAIFTHIFILYSTIRAFECATFDPAFHNNYSLWVFGFVKDVAILVFRDIFSAAYTTSKHEDYVRKCFSFLLEHFISEYIPIFLEGLTAQTPNEMRELSEKWNSDKCYLESKRLHSKMGKVGNSAIYIKQLVDKFEQAHPSVISEAIRVANSLIFSQKGYGKGFKSYYENILRRCILNGCAFLKNDIADALIIDQITDDRFLITNDKKMRDFLEKNIGICNGYRRSVSVSNHCFSNNPL